MNPLDTECTYHTPFVIATSRSGHRRTAEQLHANHPQLVHVAITSPDNWCLETLHEKPHSAVYEAPIHLFGFFFPFLRWTKHSHFKVPQQFSTKFGYIASSLAFQSNYGSICWSKFFVWYHTTCFKSTEISSKSYRNEKTILDPLHSPCPR